MPKEDFWQHISKLWYRVFTDIFAAADNMQGTVIGAAAFGGLCLVIRYGRMFYKNFDKGLWSKEHVLAIFLMLLGILTLPLFGVICAGMYGINNVFAAWQIGLTTPLIMESV